MRTTRVKMRGKAEGYEETLLLPKTNYHLGRALIRNNGSEVIKTGKGRERHSCTDLQDSRNHAGVVQQARKGG